LRGDSAGSSAASPEADVSVTLDPSTLGAFANLTNPLAALGTIFGNLSSGNGLPAQQINLPAVQLPTSGDNLRAAASNVLASAASGLPSTLSQATSEAASSAGASGEPGPPAAPVGAIPRPTVAPILNPVAALLNDPVAAGGSNLASGLLRAVQGQPLGNSVPPLATVVSAVTGNPQVGAVANDIAAGLTPVAGQIAQDGLSEARETLRGGILEDAP
jgi:hypothetical protein